MTSDKPTGGYMKFYGDSVATILPTDGVADPTMFLVCTTGPGVEQEEPKEDFERDGIPLNLPLPDHDSFVESDGFDQFDGEIEPGTYWPGRIIGHDLGGTIAFLRALADKWGTGASIEWSALDEWPPCIKVISGGVSTEEASPAAVPIDTSNKPMAYHTGLAKLSEAEKAALGLV